MSFIEKFTAYLSTEPSLEWVGPDLFISVAQDTQNTIVQSIPTASKLLLPVTSPFGLLKPFTDALTILIPTGIVITSIGYFLTQKLNSAQQNAKIAPVLEGKLRFDNYIRRLFVNQNEETISFLQDLLCRVPNEEFKLVVFFTTQASAATALNLAIRMLQMIFHTYGNELTYDDIEQEYVVPGKWYSQFAISWYFLTTLRSELCKKRGLIIDSFQDVHSRSAAILTFEGVDLFDTAFGTHLFLIINVEDAAFEEGTVISTREGMIDEWLNEKIVPYVRQDVIDGIKRQLSTGACVIQKESLATLLHP